MHWRQPGKAVETRSTPSAQPLMLILQLGFGCPFKLYLELLSIFSWKSQVKARNSFLSGLTNKRGMLIKQTNRQTDKNQKQNYKVFCVKIIYVYLGSPTTIWAICLSCHRGLQANQHSDIHSYYRQAELWLFPASGIVKKQDKTQTIWWLQPWWHFCHTTLDQLCSLLASYIFYKCHVRPTICSKYFWGLCDRWHTYTRAHEMQPLRELLNPPACLPHNPFCPQAFWALWQTQFILILGGQHLQVINFLLLVKATKSISK